MTNVRKSILWRVVLCFVGVAVFAVLVSFKMFTIQFSEGERWLSMSDSAAILRQKVTPTRGNIYSDQGALLATSMPSYEVRFDPTVVDRDTFNAQVGQLAQELSKMFPQYSASYYRNYLVQGRAKGSRYMLIHRKANYNQLKEMKTWPIFRLGRYKGGVIATLTTRRVRPAGHLALRTIGYRTNDNPGVGLERAFDNALAGDTGYRLVERISGGYRPLSIENLVEPMNGQDVHTTINVDFQEVVHKALANAVLKHKADHACAVVMEVKTGQIKAIANLKFNGEDGVTESYNYAIGENYEPGSTFKVFSAVAALEDEVLQPEDSVNVYNGERIYFGKAMKDSDKGAHKMLTFKSSFAKSSNVAFSSIIYDHYKSDPAKYIAHLKRLGLHKKLGLEILGEPEPFLNQPGASRWSKLTLPWLAIGYENQHTPLQLLAAYNAVINKGVFVKPYFVTRIMDAGLVIEEFKPQIGERVCSEETSAKLLEFTAETVLTGTARNIHSNIVSMAGKTGTAQIASKAGYQSVRQYNASFIGHFPAEDPVYSVIVLVNRPSNGIFYASYVAAPVFKELAEKIYTMSVRAEVDKDTLLFPYMVKGYGADLQTLGTFVGFSGPVISRTGVYSLSADSSKRGELVISIGEMPDVRGMGLRDALYLLEMQGLKVNVIGKGTIKKQSLQPGSKIREGSTVELRLAI